MSGYTVDWFKWIDSSGADYLTSSAYDSSNNYIYTCGYSNPTSRTVTISGINYTKPNGLSEAAYIVRYDTSGGGILTHFIDGSGGESSSTIRIDNSGNIYYAGSSGGQGTTGITISGVTYLNPARATTGTCYLVKILPNYTVSWVQFFDASGTGTNTAKNLYIDNSGFIYFLGETTASLGVIINGTYYARDIDSRTTFGSYLIKYNSSGTMQWFQSVDGLGTEQIDEITLDSSLNVYITGRTSGSATIIINGATVTKAGGSAQTTYYIAKYNVNGVYQWVRFIDTASTGSLGNPIYITYDTGTNSIYTYSGSSSSSNYINISGVRYNKPGSSFVSANYIIKTNTNFNVSAVQWITSYSNTYKIISYNNFIYTTGFCDTSISISGYTMPFFSLNNRATYLCKFDTSLQLIDINLIENTTNGPSSNSTALPDITFDNSSNIYIPNYFHTDISNIYPDYLQYTKPYLTTRASSFIKYKIANPPSTPLNISGYGGILSANLSWDPPTDANYYRIFYGVSGIFNLSGFTRLVTSTTISGLLSNTYYNFYITALNGAGSSGNSSTIYVLTLPSTPTGLSGTSFIESVNLTWNSVSGPVDYKIYYGLSGSLDLSATFTGLSGNIGGLTPDVFYNFTVVAINSSGESSQSSPIYISPEFNTVSGIIVTSNLNSFDLSWSSIPSAVSYDVYSGLSGYYSYIKNTSNTYTTISGIPNQWYNIAITTKGNNSQSTSPFSYTVYSVAYSNGPSAISAIPGVESSTINWQSLYNITNYKIYYGLSGSFDLSANFNFP